MLQLYVHTNNIVIVPTDDDLNLIKLEELEEKITQDIQNWRTRSNSSLKIDTLIDKTLFCIILCFPSLKSVDDVSQIITAAELNKLKNFQIIKKSVNAHSLFDLEIAELQNKIKVFTEENVENRLIAKQQKFFDPTWYGHFITSLADQFCKQEYREKSNSIFSITTNIQALMQFSAQGAQLYDLISEENVNINRVRDYLATGIDYDAINYTHHSQSTLLAKAMSIHRIDIATLLWQEGANFRDLFNSASFEEIRKTFNLLQWQATLNSIEEKRLALMTDFSFIDNFDLDQEEKSIKIEIKKPDNLEKLSSDFQYQLISYLDFQAQRALCLTNKSYYYDSEFSQAYINSLVDVLENNHETYPAHNSLYWQERIQVLIRAIKHKNKEAINKILTQFYKNGNDYISSACIASNIHLLTLKIATPQDDKPSILETAIQILKLSIKEIEHLTTVKISPQSLKKYNLTEQDSELLHYHYMQASHVYNIIIAPLLTHRQRLHYERRLLSFLSANNIFYAFLAAKMLYLRGEKYHKQVSTALDSILTYERNAFDKGVTLRLADTFTVTVSRLISTSVSYNTPGFLSKHLPARPDYPYLPYGLNLNMRQSFVNFHNEIIKRNDSDDILNNFSNLCTKLFAKRNYNDIRETKTRISLLNGMLEVCRQNLPLRTVKATDKISADSMNSIFHRLAWNGIFAKNLLQENKKNMVLRSIEVDETSPLVIDFIQTFYQYLMIDDVRSTLASHPFFKQHADAPELDDHNDIQPGYFHYAADPINQPPLPFVVLLVRYLPHTHSVDSHTKIFEKAFTRSLFNLEAPLNIRAAAICYFSHQWPEQRSHETSKLAKILLTSLTSSDFIEIQSQFDSWSKCHNTMTHIIHQLLNALNSKEERFAFASALLEQGNSFFAVLLFTLISHELTENQLQNTIKQLIPILVRPDEPNNYDDNRDYYRAQSQLWREFRCAIRLLPNAIIRRTVIDLYTQSLKQNLDTSGINLIVEFKKLNSSDTLNNIVPSAEDKSNALFLANEYKHSLLNELDYYKCYRFNAPQMLKNYIKTLQKADLMDELYKTTGNVITKLHAEVKNEFLRENLGLALATLLIHQDKNARLKCIELVDKKKLYNPLLLDGIVTLKTLIDDRLNNQPIDKLLLKDLLNNIKNTTSLLSAQLPIPKARACSTYRDAIKAFDKDDQSYLENIVKSGLTQPSDIDASVSLPNTAKLIEHIRYCCVVELQHQLLFGTTYWDEDNSLREYQVLNAFYRVLQKLTSQSPAMTTTEIESKQIPQLEEKTLNSQPEHINPSNVMNTKRLPISEESQSTSYKESSTSHMLNQHGYFATPNRQGYNNAIIKPLLNLIKQSDDLDKFIQKVRQLFFVTPLSDPKMLSTLLLDASLYAREKIAVWLINHITIQQVDCLNMADGKPKGNTALHYAAQANNLTIVAALLHAGANPYCINNSHEFPRNATDEKSIKIILDNYHSMSHQQMAKVI